MSASLISAKEAKKQIKKFVDKEVERHLNTIGLKIMSAIKSGKESIIYIGYEGYIYPRKHNENIIIDRLKKLGYNVTKSAGASSLTISWE